MTQSVATPPTIRLLALDVDGVMTAGEITYTQTASGEVEETKSFNVKDGLAISLAVRHGIEIAIITARESAIVSKRAEELGIQHVFQRAKTKLPVLEQLAKDCGITLSEVAYMGDDLPDIPILKAVGFSTCPADAARQVQEVCDWVSQYPGGKGAIRELVEYLIPQAFSQD